MWNNCCGPPHLPEPNPGSPGEISIGSYFSSCRRGIAHVQVCTMCWRCRHAATPRVAMDAPPTASPAVDAPNPTLSSMRLAWRGRPALRQSAEKVIQSSTAAHMERGARMRRGSSTSTHRAQSHVCPAIYIQVSAGCTGMCKPTVCPVGWVLAWARCSGPRHSPASSMGTTRLRTENSDCHTSTCRWAPCTYT